MNLSLDTLHRLWPKGNSQIPGLLEAMAEQSEEVFAKHGFSTPRVVAHFMAQISHECGAGTEVVENLNYRAEQLRSQWPTHFSTVQAVRMAHHPEQIANQAYNGRMGNRLGSDDGWTYRGRGATQTTGRDSYHNLGIATGLDLLNHPDLVNDPQHFLECGATDFVLCGCLPWAQRDDTVQVTKHLNGGLIGLQQRAAWLGKWKQALGIR